MVLEIDTTRIIGSLPPDGFSLMRAMGAEMSIIWVTCWIPFMVLVSEDSSLNKNAILAQE